VIGLLFALLAGLGDVLGGALVLGGARNRERLLAVLVGFGAGFMIAVALLEMLPAALAIEGGFAGVLVGYIIVHVTQHALTPHFHFGEETHNAAMASPSIGLWAMAGLVPHSFFDGVAIASGFLRSQELGMLIFAAIVLHKVPTGVSLASVMLVSGNSNRRTLWSLVALLAATVAGAVATPAVEWLARHGLSLAAGVTIYVAASNLIPETQRGRSWRVQGGVFAGALAFVLVRLLLGGAG
jgi:ZIP family zinc transporter/zinc and cadmium transporter